MSEKVIIIGAGLYGCVLANRLANAGYHVDIYDKRPFIGGNCYDYDICGIKVHKYGPHIFHTSNKNVWSFMNSFDNFNHFINSPLVEGADGKLYNMPFNMNTFSRIFNVKTPQEVIERISAETAGMSKNNYSNLEDTAISTVGETIYRLLVKQYTKKQWGRNPKELPASIIGRLPIRLSYDNNYFDDFYQGIPEHGYSKLFEVMLSNEKIHIHLGMSLEPDKILGSYDTPIFYTGSIDELFKYKYGKLEYRSLDFKTEIYHTSNYQGVAVINNANDAEYTRTIEWFWFSNGVNEFKNTVVTREYPCEWKKGKIRFYPINTEDNKKKYRKYRKLLFEKHSNIYIGGRLGLYKYLDMDECVSMALKQAESFIQSN